MIKITKIIKFKKKYLIKFKISKKLEKYFNHKVLVFKYNFDIKDIPNSILLIPAISNLIQVSWFTNTNLIVPEIEKNFSISLKEIIKVVNKNYILNSKSKIITEKIIKLSKLKSKQKISREICLFSGGIDSTALLIDKLKVKPKLLVANYEPAGIHKNVIAFAQKVVGRSNVIEVKSNLYSFLNRKKLDKDFGKFTQGTWWGGIQHGMSLLCLSAPIAWKYNINKVCISSTHDKSFVTNWGSDPKIDNKIRWINTICSHEHFNITRFEKVKFFIKKFKRNKRNITLAVCNSYARRSSETNCSKCGKCAQAILTLIYNNTNPNSCGFKVNDKTLSWIKESLETRTFFARKSDYWTWKDLKLKLRKRDKCNSVNLNHTLFEFFEKIKLDHDFYFNSNLVITNRPGYSWMEI